MSEMIQFIINKSKSYIHIDQTNINDNRLSWKAKGIFTYLMSRPPEWQIRAQDLFNKSSDGKSALYSGLKELIDTGYVYRAIKRGEKNEITKWIYLVVEEPISMEEAQKKLDDENTGWKIFKSKLNNENSYLLETNKLGANKLETNMHININKNNINKENINKEKEISSKEDIKCFPAENTTTSLDNSSSINSSEEKPLLRKRKRKIDRSKYVSMPKTKEENLSVSPVAQKVIDYWNVLGLRKTKTNTKALHFASIKILKLIRGTLFINDDILLSKFPLSKNKFTIDEIRKVIYRFHLAALNSEYEPQGQYKQKLKNVDINSFLYNTFVENGHRSLFLKYATEQPKERAFEKELTPEDIAVANRIIEFYKKNVLGRTKAPLLSQDRNKLIEASNKLIEFYKDNQSHIVNWARSKNDMIDLFCNSMSKVVDDELNGDWAKLTSGHFKSDTTFLRRFPAYLNSQAAFEQEETWSIYNKVPQPVLNSYDPDLDN